MVTTWRCEGSIEADHIADVLGCSLAAGGHGARAGQARRRGTRPRAALWPRRPPRARSTDRAARERRHARRPEPRRLAPQRPARRRPTSCGAPRSSVSRRGSPRTRTAGGSPAPGCGGRPRPRGGAGPPRGGRACYVGDFSPQVHPIHATRARVHLAARRPGRGRRPGPATQVGAEDALSDLREYEHLTLAQGADRQHTLRRATDPLTQADGPARPPAGGRRERRQAPARCSRSRSSERRAARAGRPETRRCRTDARGRPRRARRLGALVRRRPFRPHPGPQGPGRAPPRSTFLYGSCAGTGASHGRRLAAAVVPNGSRACAARRPASERELQVLRLLASEPRRSRHRARAGRVPEYGQDAQKYIYRSPPSTAAAPRSARASAGTAFPIRHRSRGVRANRSHTR